MPPHVYTLTGNLLAERTLVCDGWSPGRTHRARSESFSVGGKGINVSKMLTRLGVANTALCFAGGATGAECTACLAARGLAFRAFATQRPTRAGTVVRDAGGQHRETTFLGPDVPLDANAAPAVADFLEAQPAGQILALCGSVPGWDEMACDGLRAALDRWLARGTLIIDSYGPPLRWAAERRVALIKINAEEFRTLSVTDPASLPLGPQAWVVTDGAGPVWLRDTDGTTATLQPPSIAEVSATGSGDVLLACILAAKLQRQLGLRDAVAFGLPYAAANAAHPSVGEFPDAFLPGNTP